MRVGILGTGDVGRTLGTGFAALGHDVKMGSREAGNEKATAWAAESGQQGTRSAGTFAEAAAHGEVVVLATSWGGAGHALQLAGAEHLAGKVLIDVTNPLVFQPNQPPALALGTTDSAGEQVQRWAPAARVVKAFNIVGSVHMVNPSFPGGPPDMFIAGNDDAAKKTVTEILASFGWPGAIDIGGIEGARVLEPMCLLWVIYSVRSGGRNHAFKLLRK